MKKFTLCLIIAVLFSLNGCSGKTLKRGGPPDFGIVEVEGIDNINWEDNHGPCQPNMATRTIREDGDPPGDWFLISKWFPFNGVRLRDPHPFEVTFAEGKMERIVHYNCQKQICLVGSWTDDGALFACDVIEEQTVRFHSGSGGVTLHRWTHNMVDSAFNQEDYNEI